MTFQVDLLRMFLLAADSVASATVYYAHASYRTGCTIHTDTNTCSFYMFAPTKPGSLQQLISVIADLAVNLYTPSNCVCADPLRHCTLPLAVAPHDH